MKQSFEIKFVEVKAALHKVEVNFFSYWDVTGVGNEKEGHVYRGITYSTSEIQRRYLSIVVNDDFVEKTIDKLNRATDQVVMEKYSYYLLKKHKNEQEKKEDSR